MAYINGRWIPSFPGDEPPGGQWDQAAPPGPSVPNSPMDVGSGGGSSGQQPASGGGGSWNTGYSGTNGGVGTVVGDPGAPRFDWAGLQNADNISQGWTDDGLGMIQGGMGRNSAFGQQLASVFGSPYGFDPSTMGRMRTQLAETNSGSTQNALMNSAARSRAGGMGDSAGADYAQSQIRLKGADNLSRQLTDLEASNQAMAMQRQLGMGGMLTNLYGQDAGLLGSYANIQSNRTTPVYPSQGGGGYNPAGGQNSSPWWDQNGRYQTTPQPYDPFVPNNPNAGNQGTSGGWTPSNPRSMW